MSRRPATAPEPPGLEAIDRVIHEPARLMLVATLSVVESADFVFLSRQTGLTGGNLSSHMSRLESAGYVEVTKSFVGRRPQTLLSLTPAGRRAFDRYRQIMAGLLKPLPAGHP